MNNSVVRTPLDDQIQFALESNRPEEGRAYIVVIDLKTQVAKVHIEDCEFVGQHGGVAGCFPPQIFHMVRFATMVSAEWAAEWVTRGRGFKLRHCAECLILREEP